MKGRGLVSRTAMAACTVAAAALFAGSTGAVAQTPDLGARARDVRGKVTARHPDLAGRGRRL